MFNLLIIAFIVAMGYGLWIVHQWVVSTPRQLGRQAKALSREAARAAKRGEYGEAARLDDSRNAICTRLSGVEWKFEGTRYDDPTSYLDKM
jgi:hypothetical protein